MSPAAVAAARKRHHNAQQALRNASVTINGVVLPVALTRGPVRPVPKEDGSGWEKLETITVRVPKSVLLAAPGKRSVLVYAGVDYLITSIGGQSPGEIAWRLQAERRSPSAA